MPELPEVETIRRGLVTALPQRIVAIRVLTPIIVRHPDPQAFVERLEGRTIEGVRRRGKYLAMDLDDGQVLYVHLMMAGRVWLVEKAAPLLPHTHVVLSLQDGREIRYQDLRHLGGFRLARGRDGAPEGFFQLGPEPLSDDFEEGVFRTALSKRRGPIKPLLLGQHVVAGLGNIYVDEALFAARIHPERRASSLSRAEVHRLFEAIRSTLAEAVQQRGTSFGTYVDWAGREGNFSALLKVFRREGQPCLRCGTTIQKLRVGGRGTHLCPVCQRRGVRRK